MGFMEPEIVHGRWIEVDGTCGTEWIPADLVGDVEEYHGPAVAVPDSLADYCENRSVILVKIIDGYGARFSAPGYLDCTPWTVFQTEAEAQEHLDEQQEDFE